MSKKLRQIIISAVSVILAGALFASVQAVLVPKYMSGTIEGAMISEYYDNTEPHDVLILGDCEAYENISTVKLYRDYGISSYIRGSAEQYVWQSYYILRDTLKYEQPKVLIMSVHGLQFPEARKEEYNRMTLDGLKWSPLKVDAVKASMLPSESFSDYIFPIFRYHYRWSELTGDDFRYMFSKDKVTHNGYYMRCDVQPLDFYPADIPLVDYTFGSKPMEYMTKIADLCEENGIFLILYKAPIDYPTWYPEWDRQVEAFADEHEIPYLNLKGKNEEIGLDMSTDTYDAGLHLNIYGAEKLSTYLGKYLKDNYDLTDYREDKAQAEIWKGKCDDYDKMRSEQLDEIEKNGKLVHIGPGGR